MITPATFTPIGLPPCSPNAAGQADIPVAIDSWVRSDPLAELIRCFGGTPPRGSLDDALDQLAEFSDAWDNRCGGERSDIVPVDYVDSVADLITASTTALGLAGRARPPHDRYDHVLILGGGPRTALARSAFAATLLTDRVRAPHVSVLSSLRHLTAKEQRIAQRLGARQTGVEAEAMAAGVAAAFGIDPECEQRDGTTPLGAPWWTRTFVADPKFDVIAAPTSDLSRRADTADTYAGWVEYVCAPANTDRILVVTTDLFVPFQHCEAVRVLGLPFGCGIDTVGLDTAEYGRWLRPNTRTGLLQEVRSAILSMWRLHDAWRRQDAYPRA